MVFNAGDLKETIKECVSIHQSKIVGRDQGHYSYAPIEDHSQDLQSRAASRLALQLYTNQVLGPLINVAFFAYLKPRLGTLGIHFKLYTKALNLF